MTMEYPRFEDVFPIKNVGFPMDIRKNRKEDTNYSPAIFQKKSMELMARTLSTRKLYLLYPSVVSLNFLFRNFFLKIEVA